MPLLRLFAAAREAAGTATAEVPGSTVDEVLDAARARFGSELAAVIDASKVWRNGEPCAGDEPVGPGDEVAVLPPVSGGSGAADDRGVPTSRRTFSPADPPPPPRRPSPRRSPGAEAAADQRDRPGPVARSATVRPGRVDPAPGTARAPRGAERQSTPTGRRAASGPRPTTARGRPTTAKPLRPKPVPQPAPRKAPAPPPPPPLEAGALTRVPTVTGTPLAPPDPEAAPGAEGRAPTVLTRMRSVDVPVTGHVTIRGKEREVSGARQRRSLLGRRYAVVYDTTGPKVTLGVLWFVAAMAALALGWWALTFLYALAAGFAAMEATVRWRERGVSADPWVAGMGAGAVAAAAASGARYMGIAILVVVFVAVVHAAITGHRGEHTIPAAGNTVGCAIPFGLASGCVVLTLDLEIGAAVALLLFVAAYEAGDFLIGSGASNSVEGPLTGIVTIFVVAMAIAVLRIPPFDGVPAFTFAAFAAVGCPLGQLAASAILPAADAHAPAVRRLDSLLLLAPVWVWTVGVFMQST